MNMMRAILAVSISVSTFAWQSMQAADASTADKENGLHIYKTCSICHQPEGWGTKDGTYPQIAGQHRDVIIKQLEDIRSHKRENPAMDPFASEVELGSQQDIFDVASYITALPMTPDNGKGAGENIKRGDELYRLHCVTCHGIRGEGDNDKRIPMLAGQHYHYLIRQFERIRDGKRGNADPEMTKRIKLLKGRDMRDVLDYVSRLQPAKEKLAPIGWKNPALPDYTKDLSSGLKF